MRKRGTSIKLTMKILTKIVDSAGNLNDDLDTLKSHQ